MPLTLVRRAGKDTLAKLEAAARKRFREAEVLYAHGEELGAIYLFGYSIEMRLKAAYYHAIGLAPSSAIEKLHRKPAEDAIDAMPLLPKHPVVGGPYPGHHIVGWARLLEQTRATGAAPMDATLAKLMHQHANATFMCWVEFLRYRANEPYDVEITAVRSAARWFRANATRLWS